MCMRTTAMGLPQPTMGHACYSEAAASSGVQVSLRLSARLCGRMRALVPNWLGKGGVRDVRYLVEGSPPICYLVEGLKQVS